MLLTLLVGRTTYQLVSSTQLTATLVGLVVCMRSEKDPPIGHFTEREWYAVVTAQQHCCAYCKQKTFKLHKDHVVPRSLGGTNFIWNIQALCGPCNLRKSNHFVGPVKLYDDHQPRTREPRIRFDGLDAHLAAIIEADRQASR